MKRRVEEAAKQEGSSSGGPAVVYGAPVRHQHSRTFTTQGSTVQSPFLTTPTVSKSCGAAERDRVAGGAPTEGTPSIGEGVMPAFSMATSFHTALPGATATAIKGTSSSVASGGGMHSTLHTLQAQAQPQHGLLQTQAHQQVRHKVHGGSTTPPTVAIPAPQQTTQQQQQQQHFQKLKVEDALSYLDQVKDKFKNQPQVYNDFLDIMKEFKSQSIDTPGVIDRVSTLFKGHPKLIGGFNTFLPPGYKIEVHSNDQGYSFKVSRSTPSPTASTTTIGGGTVTNMHAATLVAPTMVVTPTAPAVPSPVLAPPPSVAVPIGKPVAIIKQPKAHHEEVAKPRALPSFRTSVKHGCHSSPTNTVVPLPSTVLSAGSAPVPTLLMSSGGASQPAASSPAGAPLPSTPSNLHHPSYNRPSTPAPGPTPPVSGPGQGPGPGPGPGQSPAVTPSPAPTPTPMSTPVTSVHTPTSPGVVPPSTTSVSSSVPPPPPQTQSQLVPNSHIPPSHVNSNLNNSSTGGSTTGLTTVVPAGPASGPLPSPATGPTTGSTASSVTTNSSSALHHSGVVHVLSQAHQAAEGLQQHSTHSQPVEFNHAINYVNKIKNRFQGQPDKYKRFLEILHTYQKEQRNLKEGGGPGAGTGGKHLTEAEVYSQVAKLFENQVDLLTEFGQFLPDATSHSHQASSNKVLVGNDHQHHPHPPKKAPGLKQLGYSNSNSCSSVRERDNMTSASNLVMIGSHPDRTHTAPLGPSTKIGGSGAVKRSPSFSSPTSNTSHHGHSHLHSSTSHSTHSSHGPPPPKRMRACLRDVSMADAGKLGTLTDYAFFDTVHRMLRNQDVYTNFLRCLQLFNDEVVSKSELLQLVTPFLGKYPELFRRFKDFIGSCDGNVGATGVHSMAGGMSSLSNNNILGGVENISNNVVRQDRPSGDPALEIDYATCKRLGASYCAVPKGYVQPKCTGRTALCREVLNDTWVSFPTWSEDSTFVTSRKTQYEEYIYRCEDERFELDVVIETNTATIRVLEGVAKKLQRLSQEEVAKFRLDDCLGGASPTIHQRALRRIYGEKAADIIDGLKKNPSVAVPVVLRRLKAKEEEWREAQKGFNKIWREQNEKYYLKSLDHQGINFKPNDLKSLRSKSLFNDIESLYDERHEQPDDEANQGPHLVLAYKDRSVLNDAAELLIHHVKRQTSIHKDDKQRIKQLLRQFWPDLFFHPRQELSDDERDDQDDAEEKDDDADTLLTKTERPKKEDVADVKPPPHAISQHPDECYTLFFANNNWYLFLRLHHILCERLTRMYERAVAIATEEAKYRTDRKESTAVALRLKPKNEIDVEDYYPAFLDMVRNVLDGNMDSNAYEDTLREMFGIHAYIAFTLDKVVIYAVRQLQHMVTDDPCTECMDLFLSEQRRGGLGTGGPCSSAHQRTSAEIAYQRRAEQALADENCFKILVYKQDCKVTVELLDNLSEGATENAAESNKWSKYNERERRFSTTGDDANNGNNGEKEERDVECANVIAQKAVFLSRNVRGKKKDQDIDVSNSLTPSLVMQRDSPPATPMEVDEPTEGQKKGKDKSSSEGDEEGDGDADEDVESSGGRRQTKLCKSKPMRLNHKMGGVMDVSDDMPCHFDFNMVRAVYTVIGGHYLYRLKSLPKARESHPEVSTRLNNKFREWHGRWSRDNVTDVQQKYCNDWLMGRGEGVVQNRTRAVVINDSSKAPYRPYTRYRVDRIVSESSNADSA